MVKSSVLWPIVYLAVSNYPDGGFFPSFCFFFSSPSSFFFFLHSRSNSMQTQGLWQAQYAQREDEFASQGGADDMNKDWEEKKGTAR